MFTKEDKNKLREIQKKFEEIEALYDEFNLSTKEKIFQYHNEEGSLPYCIRWGIQATEEFLGEETLPKAGTIYKVKKDINCEIGYIPKGAKAQIELVDSDEIDNLEGEPFQVKFDRFNAYKKEDEHDGYYKELSFSKIKKYLTKN